MKRAKRTQVDEQQREYSIDASIDFSEDTPANRDMARQEFKADADVNTILKKFGATGNMDLLNAKQPIYSTADFDMDLQQALDAIDQVKLMYQRDLSQEIRNRYPTWQKLLGAIESGELQISKNKPVTDTVVTENVKPATAGVT